MYYGIECPTNRTKRRSSIGVSGKKGEGINARILAKMGDQAVYLYLEKSMGK
jgi:hypothetical protein